MRKCFFKSLKRIVVAFCGIQLVTGAFVDLSFAKAPDIYMNLSRSDDGLIGIAIPEFVFVKGKDLENFSSRGAEILLGDLDGSGYFNVVDNKRFVRELDQDDRKNGSINFEEWKTLGAEALIKGRVVLNGNDISIECRLYDVYKGRQIVGIKYKGERTALRQIMHRFSNEVVYRFTGEKGIALTRIAFVSKSGGHKEVYVTDYDGKNLKRITNDRSIALYPKWAPNAKSIIFATYKQRNPDLYQVKLRNLRSKPLSQESGLNAPASFSPDGKKMVITMSKGGNTDLYMRDVKGKRLKRLTYKRSIETSPAWSPTGRLISYTSDRSGTPQVYIMDIDGSNERRLTYGGSYSDQSAWSPDGSRLAFASLRNRHFNICVLDLVDNETRCLTRRARDNQSPTWSPDGKKIAFSSNRNGTYQIYVMNYDGTSQRQLLFAEGGGYSPDWSPKIEFD